MEELMKHTGRLNSTTRKVVVVFPQLPDDSEHCLIVETETMPDKYHDNIMQIVESAEAQDTNNLSDVLARKMFWDGNPVLQVLHSKGFLRRTPVSDVTLYPTPSQGIPLKDQNAIAKVSYPEAPAQSEKNTKAGAMENPSDETDKEGIAKNLIIQAQLLEEDARIKRAQAEEIFPGINDTTKRPRGRPTKTTKEKLKKAVEEKV